MEDETESPDIEEQGEYPVSPLQSLIEATNIASSLDEEQLELIGDECSQGYETDSASSESWRDMVSSWMEMATQVIENKSYPWPNSSNVKYPLVSVAAMQFSARAYPTLIPADGKIVKPVVIGADVTGEKLKRAERVAKYMNYQLMHEMDNWEEDMDRLLIMDAIMGTVFKKTFYDPYTEKMCSKLIDPRNLVINYDAESLEKAERISEDVYLYEREVDERKRMGIYLDVDIGKPTASSFDHRESVADDSTIPYFLIEQHTWLDLDDDGVKEPYVVTFHKDTKKVLRIAARFMETGAKFRDGKLVRIEALQYYTKYGFIPNPESRIYDLGFGHLLGPINESVNTIINQLVDAGTLANLQSGFIGKGLRLKMGDQILKPGEWKAVNATGDDLKKQIVPLPTKEPSSTLFNLLGTLITSGKELASVAEIFVGKMPGQNTPATTTMATIEQGMKVFTAIYKRIYRSLYKEFKKLYRLNGTFLDPQTMVLILDEPTGPADFSMDGYDICPGADPTAVSSTERLLKAQGLLELLPLGTIDPVKVTMRVLEAQDQPNWQELIPGMAETGQPQIPPPPPDPKVQHMQMKMEADAQLNQLKQQAAAMKLEMDQRSAEFKLMMEESLGNMKLQQEAQKSQLEGISAVQKQKIFMAESMNKAAVKNAETGQKMVHNEALNQQKVRHQEESAKSKSAASSSSTGPKKK
jgi:chaperonin GroES